MFRSTETKNKLSFFYQATAAACCDVPRLCYYVWPCVQYRNEASYGTETQIFRELSILSLISLIQIESSPNSVKGLSNTTYPIRELFNWMIELCN